MTTNNNKTIVKKIEYILLIIFTLFTIGFIIQNIKNYNFINILKAAGTLILIYVPLIVVKIFKFHLTSEFHIIVQLYIFLAVYLGGVCRLYYTIWWLDSTLHATRGLLLGFTGFILIFMLNKIEMNLNLNLSFIVIFMFGFSSSISVIWEIFEFTMDALFNTSMQIFGLVDTMWDIVADSCGTIISIIIICFYLKTGKENIVIKLINKFLVSNSRKAVEVNY